MKSEVNVNIDSARSDVETFTTTNNSLKTNYANLKNNVSAGIAEFGIPYFAELEAYVNEMHEKNDRYQLGANKYLDDLISFESLTYNNGDISTFPNLGDAAGGGDVSDANGKNGGGTRGGNISEDTYDGGDPDGEVDVEEPGKRIDEEDEDVGPADGEQKPVEETGTIGPESTPVGSALEDEDTPGETGKIDDEAGDVGDSEGKAGDKDAGGDVLDDFGKIEGATGGNSHGGRAREDSTGDGITEADEDVADALSDEEAEDLLAKLLEENNDTVQTAQGQSAAAGLSEAIHGTGEEVHKGGVGLGALAAVLGTIAAGGAGLGALSGHSHDKDLTLNDIAGKDGKVDGRTITPEMKTMLGEIAAATSGHTLSELMSGNYPEATATAINSVNTVMNVVEEAGIVTAEETNFAMSGMPYQLGALSSKQLDALYLELGDLIDRYGGVEGFLESAQAKAFIDDMAAAYDALKTVLGKDPQEVRKALAGLLDPNSPNIGGVPISREVRDFMIKYLQGTTGLSIQALLDGQHDRELLSAVEDLMEVLEVFKCLSGLTKEELRKFLYDILNGKFPELSGITPFTAKALRDYLTSFCQRMRIPAREIYTVPARSEMLRQAIREVSSAKTSLRALTTQTAMDAQTICSKVMKGEMINVVGRNVDSVTMFLIKSGLNVIARFNKCSIDLLLTDAKFKPVLGNMLKDFLKYTVFNGMFATLKPDKLVANMTAMFTGKNYGLNGFTFVDIEAIKNTCEDFAFKQNIKVTDLFNNKAHAGVFKQVLAASDIFIKLMLIFENLSDGDVQVLINNVVNTWKEEFKERLQNLLNYANKKRVDKLVKEASEDTISNMRVVSEEALKTGLDRILELGGDDFYGCLLDIYQGKKLRFEVTDELRFLIKLFLTIISINQKLAVKDLMKNEDARFLIRELLPYVKLYPNKLANRGDLFKLKPLSEFIGAVLGGYYPDLLGYSGDKYTALKDSYYAMAERKSLNVKDLFGNIAHAVEVATTVANDQRNRVLAVFVREIPEIPTQRFMSAFILNIKK